MRSLIPQKPFPRWIVFGLIFGVGVGLIDVIVDYFGHRHVRRRQEGNGVGDCYDPSRGRHLRDRRRRASGRCLELCVER